MFNEPTDNEFLEIQDLGVTMRTLLARAAERLEATGRRRYKVRYKFMEIGTVNVRPQGGR